MLKYVKHAQISVSLIVPDEIKVHGSYSVM